jgi:hypothetical protein
MEMEGDAGGDEIFVKNLENRENFAHFDGFGSFGWQFFVLRGFVGHVCEKIGPQ